MSRVAKWLQPSRGLSLQMSRVAKWLEPSRGLSLQMSRVVKWFEPSNGVERLLKFRTCALDVPWALACLRSAKRAWASLACCVAQLHGLEFPDSASQYCCAKRIGAFVPLRRLGASCVEPRGVGHVEAISHWSLDTSRAICLLNP